MCKVYVLEMFFFLYARTNISKAPYVCLLACDGIILNWHGYYYYYYFYYYYYYHYYYIIIINKKEQEWNNKDQKLNMNYQE